MTKSLNLVILPEGQSVREVSSGFSLSVDVRNLKRNSLKIISILKSTFQVQLDSSFIDSSHLFQFSDKTLQTLVGELADFEHCHCMILEAGRKIPHHQISRESGVEEETDLLLRTAMALLNRLLFALAPYGWRYLLIKCFMLGNAKNHCPYRDPLSSV